MNELLKAKIWLSVCWVIYACEIFILTCGIIGRWSIYNIGMTIVVMSAWVVPTVMWVKNYKRAKMNHWRNE